VPAGAFPFFMRLTHYFVYLSADGEKITYGFNSKLATDRVRVWNIEGGFNVWVWRQDRLQTAYELVIQ